MGSMPPSHKKLSNTKTDLFKISQQKVNVSNKLIANQCFFLLFIAMYSTIKSCLSRLNGRGLYQGGFVSNIKIGYFKKIRYLMECLTPLFPTNSYICCLNNNSTVCHLLQGYYLGLGLRILSGMRASIPSHLSLQDSMSCFSITRSTKWALRISNDFLENK